MDLPPQPPTGAGSPPFRRAVRIARLEGIGVPLLALLPVLSLAGLLGPSYSHTTSTEPPAQPSAVALDVEHPTRLRHRAAAHLVISVRNAGSAALNNLSVGIGEDYMARFSQPTFTPVSVGTPAGRFEVALPPLQAGDVTRVHVWLEADAWGHHKGQVQVKQHQRVTLARVDFGTTVLP